MVPRFPDSWRALESQREHQVWSPGIRKTISAEPNVPAVPGAGPHRGGAGVWLLEFGARAGAVPGAFDPPPLPPPPMLGFRN